MSTFINHFAYSGAVIDEESGFYYLNARYYDPATGRFISLDPVRQGSNWYVYCFGNPVNMADPSGLYAGQTLRGSNSVGAYGEIYDPLAYVKQRYGGTITVKASRSLSISPVLMSDLGRGPICVFTSISNILYYYARNGYPKIPGYHRPIYERALRLYQGKMPVNFWDIDELVRDTARSYGYRNSTGTNTRGWNFSDNIRAEIDGNHPTMLSMIVGVYRNHAVTVNGYRVYNSYWKLVWAHNDTPNMIRVADGYNAGAMYIDYQALKATSVSQTTKVRVRN